MVLNGQLGPGPLALGPGHRNLNENAKPPVNENAKTPTKKNCDLETKKNCDLEIPTKKNCDLGRGGRVPPPGVHF